MTFEFMLRVGLWVIPIILQIFIAGIMLRRRLLRPFKYFFSYCLAVSARDVALLFLQHHADIYSAIYWVGDGLLLLLQAAVLGEVFCCLLPLDARFRRIIVKIFQTIVPLSALIVFLVFTFAVNTRGETIEAILVLEKFSRGAQAAILVLAIMLISKWGLGWKHDAVGILLGFGVAGLQIVPAELRGSMHLISNEAFVWLKPAIYDCAVVVWTVYFIIRPRPVSGLRGFPHSDLSQWDVVLKGYLYR